MEQVEQTAISTDPWHACCLCTGLLRDAVQLACLHNCCRQCFRTASSQSSSQGVVCGSCRTVTQVGGEQPNDFIDGEVQWSMLIAESGYCAICTEKGEHDTSAVFWCLTCRHSLCEDCVNEHLVNDGEHTLQYLEQLRSLDELQAQVTATACAVHKRPLEFACLDCEQTKCSICWTECMESNHTRHIVGDWTFDNYVENLVARISTMERKCLRKSEASLENPRNVLRFTNAARDRHLNELEQRKRRIMDAVEKAYKKIQLAVNNAYGDLKAKGDEACATADGIASDLSVARSYIRRLSESNNKREIFKQQKTIRERLSSLSTQLDSLSARLVSTVGEVKIEASLPEDLEKLCGEWIGKHQVHAASSSLLQQLQLPQCFSFGAASVSVKLPVACRDVALTKNGRSLLLAAGQQGLIEFCSSSGRELSRWGPPKHDNGTDDKVEAVAALSDGRAAVSLLQCIVVLKRREERRKEKDGGRAAVNSWLQWLVDAGDDAWTEQLHVMLPRWRPRLLSAHGDVLAATCSGGLWCTCSGGGGLVAASEYSWSARLQLLSLSSGQLLLSTKLKRKYQIRSLAVTARAVVTGSMGHWNKLDLLGTRAACVLDAHSLADDGSDKRLWRHELSRGNPKEEDELQGICADSSGGCLYAAVCRSDKSSSRVSVLSLADGSELRRVALSFDPAAAAAAPAQPLLLPMQLSLSDDVTVSSSGRVLLLAALCWDSETKKWKTVTLHRSISDELL